jgi:hypothetical protein
MSTRLLLAAVAALLIVRLPSLVQPMGSDQGLYAYVGERILHGELAYRDAWDQKPPGIHYIYAGLRAISSRDMVVPAADLAAAAIIAALLWVVGGRIAGPLAGGWSAVLFLLLSDPSLTRLAGVRIRAQGETFIALAITAALASLALGAGAKGAGGASGARGAGAKGALVLLGAGVLLGAAFSIKYNAGLYGLVLVVALAVSGRLTLGNILWLGIGTAIVPAALAMVFWRGGALDDLYQATIAYNLHYSGQTYTGPIDMARYLVLFPIEHARVDALWFAGGLGCAVLLVAAIWNRAVLVPVAWVALACGSIAINGSRNLPQYFVQATPALALAAGVAIALTIPKLPKILAWAAALVLAIFIWRAGDDPFPRMAGKVWHDLSYASGRIDRRTHLAYYGGTREVDKYSALDNMDLGAMLASATGPDEAVFVFGYSPGSYVYANRKSASRFFWSRPVILDFNRENPSYGVAGLATDLARAKPAMVVLQMRDWAPDVQDSGPFFLSQPRLADWLRAEYHQIPAIDGFQAWERNGRAPR